MPRGYESITDYLGTSKRRTILQFVHHECNEDLAFPCPRR